jgi:hypothetical protein
MAEISSARVCRAVWERRERESRERERTETEQRE